MSYKTKIAFIIAIFFWASAFVGIRISLDGYSPGGLALFRGIIASFFMGILYYRLCSNACPQPISIGWKDMLGMLIVGAFGIGIYNITLNYGEISISSGTASFIVSQAPIITAILAVVFLGEQIGMMHVIGFLISMLGIALISMGESGGFKFGIGIWYVLIAAITGGAYSILQKHFLKKYHFIIATTFVLWGGTLFLIFYLPQLIQEVLHAPLQSTMTAIYLGIFPTTLAYMAWSYALQETTATRATNFLYTMPFVSTLLGWWCLKEQPVLLTILGGICAMFGVWLVNQSYKVTSTENA